MNYLWNISIADYEEVCRRAIEAGIQPGESIELIFLEYMKEKNQRPISGTEFTRDELLAQIALKNDNVLDISVNTQGDATYRVINKPNKKDIL